MLWNSEYGTGIATLSCSDRLCHPGGVSSGSGHDKFEVHTYCAIGQPRILFALASVAALLRKIDVTHVALSSIIIVIIVAV